MMSVKEEKKNRKGCWKITSWWATFV